ncbi:MAG: hypothetical protein QW597_06930 [Thermoplasmataceae archaeon]
MSWLLYASGVVILVGAAILRIANLVPAFLTYGTVLAAIVVFVTAFFVNRQNNYAEFFGVLLGIISIIVTSNPAHLSALLQFGRTAVISAADITMILGFYLLPITYIALYVGGKHHRLEPD